MNKEEYIYVTQRPHISEKIRVIDLKDKSDRTLMYGYDLDRNDWHLYIQDGYFNLVVNQYDGKIIEQHLTLEEIEPGTYPSKRLYPETCDIEYVDLVLNTYHISLPFTTFNETREKEQFYGLII